MSLDSDNIKAINSFTGLNLPDEDSIDIKSSSFIHEAVGLMIKYFNMIILSIFSIISYSFILNNSLVDPTQIAKPSTFLTSNIFSYICIFLSFAIILSLLYTLGKYLLSESVESSDNGNHGFYYGEVFVLLFTVTFLIVTFLLGLLSPINIMYIGITIFTFIVRQIFSTKVIESKNINHFTILISSFIYSVIQITIYNYSIITAIIPLTLFFILSHVIDYYTNKTLDPSNKDSYRKKHIDLLSALNMSIIGIFLISRVFDFSNFINIFKNGISGMDPKSWSNFFKVLSPWEM